MLRDRRTWISLGIVVVIAAIAIAVGGATSSEPKDDDSAAGPPAEQRCVDLWNSADTNFGRTSLGAMADRAKIYVTVGFAADYPDKCLVSASAPSFQMTWQYIEGDGSEAPGGAFADAGGGGDLPDSAKDWNATVDSSGMLSLGRP